MHPGLKLQFFKENNYNTEWVLETEAIAQHSYSKYAGTAIAEKVQVPTDSDKVIWFPVWSCPYASLDPWNFAINIFST